METQRPLEPCMETSQSLEPSEIEEEEEEEEKTWWWRLEPLLNTFRIVCQTYLILGTKVAIDEIMVRFHGRLSDTCKMLNKLIKQGYKIFALAEDGYV